MMMERMQTVMNTHIENVFYLVDGWWAGTFGSDFKTKQNKVGKCRKEV